MTPRHPRPGSLRWAAAQIGVSLPTVYKLIRQGRLRAFKVGRGTRVSERAVADCIAVLEEQCPVRLRRSPCAQHVGASA